MGCFSPHVVSFIYLQFFASKEHPVFHLILSDKHKTQVNTHQSFVNHIPPVLITRRPVIIISATALISNYV